MNDLRMNVKVCEGCGALWLRAVAVEGVYCRMCVVHLAEFPAPRKRHARGRQRLVRVAGCPASQTERVAAVAGGAR